MCCKEQDKSSSLARPYHLQSTQTHRDHRTRQVYPDILPWLLVLAQVLEMTLVRGSLALGLEMALVRVSLAPVLEMMLVRESLALGLEMALVRVSQALVLELVLVRVLLVLEPPSTVRVLTSLWWWWWWWCFRCPPQPLKKYCRQQIPQSAQQLDGFGAWCGYSVPGQKHGKKGAASDTGSGTVSAHVLRIRPCQKDRTKRPEVVKISASKLFWRESGRKHLIYSPK
jgi:hypothetical protein